MAAQPIDFEKPILEMETKIEELQQVSQAQGVDLTAEVKRLQKKTKRLRRDIFAKLNRWEQTLLARHPERPYAEDYIKLMMTDFVELHGDRLFGDDHAVIGGLARFEGKPVVVIGQQKGRSTKQKIYRNFGMPHPEGYRKALRLMKMAEKFNRPVITLIDTPGAYPGLGAEERGQAEAIARNLREMAALTVPLISVVIGEGGSGGALGLGVGNRVLMLQYSVYSVIMPEGCASILYRDSGLAAQAAESLKLAAKDLKEYELIDEIVKEPPGGAHRNHQMAASILRRVIRRHLAELICFSPQELIKQREQKFRNFGQYMET